MKMTYDEFQAKESEYHKQQIEQDREIIHKMIVSCEDAPWRVHLLDAYKSMTNMIEIIERRPKVKPRAIFPEKGQEVVGWVPAKKGRK